MIKNLFLFALTLSCFFLRAQQAAPKKTHYNIINPNSKPTELYEKAMSHTNIDSLRFLNERRTISIEGTDISIELYSAQELLALYNKKISPLTKDPATARKVKLKLSPDQSSLRVLPLNEP